MTTRAPDHQLISSRVSAGAALTAGLLGLGLLILPDMDMLMMVTTIPALGFLCAGDRYYAEHDRERVKQALATAFQWLMIAIFIAFAFLLLLKSLHIFGGVVDFMGVHWPALVLSAMCIFAGIAGLRKSSA